MSTLYTLSKSMHSEQISIESEPSHELLERAASAARVQISETVHLLSVCWQIWSMSVQKIVKFYAQLTFPAARPNLSLVTYFCKNVFGNLASESTLFLKLSKYH